MVKYGKKNLSTKDTLLYIDIDESENKIANEETEDSVTDLLTNDQKHLITNKSRNYKSKSIMLYLSLCIRSLLILFYFF